MTFRFEKDYSKFLNGYIKEGDEKYLYNINKWSKEAISQGVSPEEIVGIHRTALLTIPEKLPDIVLSSLEVLMTVMVNYGADYRRNLIIKKQQEELQKEILKAGKIQKSLLQTEIPSKEHLDVGVCDKPANQMSGDYYHFFENETAITVSLADVIGKGIPAALAMSMLKYGMQNAPDDVVSVSGMLSYLNKVVEENISDNMFITMFLGVYDKSNKVFTYSSAGHEIGFWYNALDNEYQDLYAKGLMLGIQEEVTYHEYQRSLSIGDFIVVLSDGVTETRIGDGFIERETLKELIYSFHELSAQDITDNVYKKLAELQNFKLYDDFTLIIIKRIA